jgi:hypothetical protein
VANIFTCAYCEAPSPIPSVAHIFPDAVGGVTAPRTTVCRSCNSIVTSRVENPAVTRFAFFRNGMELWGRHGDLPKVPAFVESMGEKLPISVGQGGELPPRGIVREIETEKGTGIVVMGEGAWVEERKEQLSEDAAGVQVASPRDPVGSPANVPRFQAGTFFVCAGRDADPRRQAVLDPTTARTDVTRNARVVIQPGFRGAAESRSRRRDRRVLGQLDHQHGRQLIGRRRRERHRQAGGAGLGA